MKNGRIFSAMFLLALFCIFFGCNKEGGDAIDENHKGSVYGTVTFGGTGNPVANAVVQLRPRILNLSGVMRQTGFLAIMSFVTLKRALMPLQLPKLDMMIGLVALTSKSRTDN